INISGLSDEIMMLARSYVQVERELYQYKNEYDTLLERNQELEDKVAKHQKKNHSSSTANSSLQQQNVSLQQQVQSLEQQLATNSQMQQQNVSLQKRIQDLEQTANASSKSVSHSHHRSAEHPDPDVFSADNPELRKELPLFIRKINMKFIANEDWYPSAQSKMIYLISRLKGKAYSTIAYGINRDGTVKFASRDAILVLLEQAFADVDECNSARRKILTLKQGQKDTSTHISDWFEVAQKTELSDNALINHLYDSLHPAIASHIQNRIMLRQALPTDLTSYLVEVRH
ncbi:hypothetical protein K3495_g16427, partial [Podosphaera aphanis]